ncbi:HNH endonuclease signature motif containing protein [Gordonia aichiensis]|uniref:HNH endonuclease signature motif containing protein n=1 Tax=Gordonia aichiensis TaxID=36820 RepID=UPI00326449DC
MNASVLAAPASQATRLSGGLGSFRADAGQLTVELPLPTIEGAADLGALMSFAGGAGAVDGVILWFRYAAIYRVLDIRLRTVADVTEFGRVCDPYAQVSASFGVVANVGAFAADSFLDRAVACIERIPATGLLMRDGLLSPAAFARAVLETSLVEDPDVLAVIDAELSYRLRGMGGLSVSRVSKTAHAVVAEFDPDAARAARAAAKAGKRVVLAPLTFELSELTVTASAEDNALSVEIINALIAGVCARDPRTKDQRRSDAVTSRIHGTAFTCRCGIDECDAELSDESVAARCASIVLHVVCRRETLDGTTTTPAYLDGFGPISAQHVRDIVERNDAVVRDLDLDVLAEATHQSADPHRPTAMCDAAVRGLFGQCTTPGCDRAAWKCDLDHVVEFNHAEPAAGGATCPCNLNPKCRHHHLIKTHCAGWIDEQFIDAASGVWTEVTTPEGITVRQRALNNWLLPEIGQMQCRHGAVIEPGTADPADEPQRSETRLAAKHRYRRQMRSANRRAREAREAATDAYWGEPSF